MKKIKNTKITAFVLALTVMTVMSLAAGCVSDGSDVENGYITLYYLNYGKTALNTTDEAKDELTDKGDDVCGQAKALMERLRGSFSDGVSVIPDTLLVQEYEYNNDAGILSVYFNTAYESMDTLTEVLVRCAIVRTLTQIKGVEFLKFYVGDEEVTDAQGEPLGNMRASDFVDQTGDSFNNYEAVTLMLYFANKGGDALTAETRTVMYDSSYSIEYFIVDQLIDGPQYLSNHRTLTADVEINSVTTSGGVCYVDLTRQFSKSASTVKDEIMIYSIVNSLTELDYVNKVQISIDGVYETSLHNRISLSEPFERDMSYVNED